MSNEELYSGYIRPLANIFAERKEKMDFVLKNAQEIVHKMSQRYVVTEAEDYLTDISKDDFTRGYDDDIKINLCFEPIKDPFPSLPYANIFIEIEVGSSEYELHHCITGIPDGMPDYDPLFLTIKGRIEDFTIQGII